MTTSVEDKLITLDTHVMCLHMNSFLAQVGNTFMRAESYVSNDAPVYPRITLLAITVFAIITHCVTAIDNIKDMQDNVMAAYCKDDPSLCDKTYIFQGHRIIPSTDAYDHDSQLTSTMHNLLVQQGRLHVFKDDDGIIYNANTDTHIHPNVN